MTAAFAFASGISFAFAFACGGCDEPDDDQPVVTLGQARLSGYHLLAGGSTTLPGGAIGYMITANGRGGYQLTFTDTAGSAARFAGSISTDVGFDGSGTSKYSGEEDLSFTSLTRIDFSGVPEASVEGVDFVTESDPVYLDVTVDGSHDKLGIFFTGATTGLVQQSKFNPVAFASP